MFDFELCIDTSDSKPVCYHHPAYGIRKKKMIKNIQILEDNDWICDYVSPWDSLLLLTTKPHQEDCTCIIFYSTFMCQLSFAD